MSTLIHFATVVLAVLVISIQNEPIDADGSYLAALQKPVIPSQSIFMKQQPTLRHSFQHQNDKRHYNQGDRDGKCSTNYKFDYLMLTLQWGPGFCATSPQECKRSENRFFTVHGMWPQLWNSQPIASCCFDNTFYYKLIEPLVPDLEKYWISYYNKNSSGFWRHEWLKHGTCLRDVKQLQGEKQFFVTTLGIVKRMPVLDTLVKAGIVPRSKEPYQSVAILNALKHLTGGKRAMVVCDLEAHQSNALLTGVNFCFDANLNFTDCPSSKTRCQRQLLFLE